MTLSFAAPRIQTPCFPRRVTAGTQRLTVTVCADYTRDEQVSCPHLHPLHPTSPTSTPPQAFATNHWQTLGVAPGANLDSIKRAYRKQALKLHPDVNRAPDASARFIELQHAYEQLCKGTEHDDSWEPSPNMGQRGCRAVWERQVAGMTKSRTGAGVTRAHTRLRTPTMWCGVYIFPCTYTILISYTCFNAHTRFCMHTQGCISALARVPGVPGALQRVATPTWPHSLQVWDAVAVGVHARLQRLVRKGMLGDRKPGEDQLGVLYYAWARAQIFQR